MLQSPGLNQLPNLAALSLNGQTPGLQQMPQQGLHDDGGVLVDPYGYNLQGQGARMMMHSAMPQMYYQA